MWLGGLVNRSGYVGYHGRAGAVGDYAGDSDGRRACPDGVGSGRRDFPMRARVTRCYVCADSGQMSSG